MINHIKRGVKYLSFLTTAQSKYSIHSPFVYELVTNVFEDERYFYAFDTIQNLRKRLLAQHDKIKVKDYGGGSKINKQTVRRISDIGYHSCISHKYGQLLFRIVQYFQPEIILELGTSLGLSASYLGLAKPTAKVVTLEGCPNTAKLARQNFKKIGASNIQLTKGVFRQTLPQQLNNCSKVDLVFFDGDHRQAATIHYFEQCLEKAHNDSLFIFDDIRHSDEMEAAWEQIIHHNKVQISIDLFQMGLVFFRQQQAAQHFKIRF